MAMDLFKKGMRVTLIKALKRILDQYPNNSQILKEILQNAEDAGARHVKFLLDETHHGETMGLSPDDPAYPYLGPALYVYNDAHLTDNDWKGISDIEGSIKANDPTTIGRFGLGFKSVFHITDVPSIYSGDNIGFLDPHEKLLWKDGYRTPVFGCCLHSPAPECPGKHLFQEGPYQYDIFNSKSVKNYQHTIFRFPLRNKRHSSQLSDEGCSVADIWELLETLCKESYMNLLFMKNIEKIEVYRRRSFTEEPFLHFTVELSGDILEETQRGRANTKNMMNHNWKLSAEHVAYRMCVKETRFHNKTPPSENESQWFVCNSVDTGKNSSDTAKIADDLKLMPMVGVAIPLQKSKSQGHLYCCLPLPLEGKSPTGLPVHVNGCFVLDQTRHHLKWSTIDSHRAKSQETHWNHILVKEIIPQTYIHLLQEIKEFIEQRGNNPEDIQSWMMDSLPNETKVQHYWKEAAVEFYHIYCEENLLHTQAGGGKWISPRDAVYINPNMIRSLKDLLHHLLTDLNQPLGRVSQYVTESLKKNFPISMICPADLRQFLRGKTLPSWLSEQDKLQVLGYILSDNVYHDLGDIALLPLSTGDFTTFSTGYGGELIYMASTEHPQELLPGLEHMFLLTINEPGLQATMKKLALSDQTQLTCFDAEKFTALLPKVSLRDQSYFWFNRIWKYLTIYFPDTLQQFHGLELLPVKLTSGSTEFLQLGKGNAWLLLQQTVGKTNLDEQTCLNTLGVKLIQTFLCDVALGHPQILGHYVHSDSPGGILECLNKLPESDTENVAALFYKKTSVTEKLSFQSCCSRIISAADLVGVARTLFRKLAFFQLEGTDGTIKFTSCENTQVGCREKLVSHNEDVVDLSTDSARILAKELGMKEISTTQLIKDYILPSVKTTNRYTESEVDVLVKYIFNNDLLKKSGIRNQLSSLAFVSTQVGGKNRASELYDPKDSLIRPFLNRDMIPGQDYIDFILPLKQLGLITADTVTASDVLAFANKASSHTNFDMANSLLKLLSYRPKLLSENVDDQELGKLLTTMSWVPVKQKIPGEYPEGLPWFNSTVRLAKPIDVISKKYQYIIGGFAPMLDCSQLHPGLIGYFNWNRNPDIDMIIRQLEQLAELSKRRTGSSSKFGHITEKIYGHIQDRLHQADVAQAYMKIKQFIWNGKNFVPVEKVVFNLPLSNMEPYMYGLPGEYKKFKRLLTKCGMAQTCCLKEVLNCIKDSHTGSTQLEEDTAIRDRKLAISILEKISEDDMDKNVLDDIPVPVWAAADSLQMQAIKDVVYDDRVWQSGFHSEDQSEDLFFVHPLVSPNLAKALKLKTLAARVLDVKEMFFEAFGQQEPLTNRIKNILKEYPDGLSVPKELIQNADDADATEVAFLFDERTHEDHKTKLFDKGMAEFQGPALFAYNNATFSEKDFENLIKLGGRTKEQLMEKVGKFGLGFNAVYHLTDVPSFISGRHMVVLDPHVSHLGKCIRDPRHPGIRVTIGQKKSLRQFSDQFQPFEGVFGCAAMEAVCDEYSYPGTLFRFPLRTKSQATDSEICGTVYDQAEMKKLLKIFTNSIHSCLLFTQNVKKVSLYWIPATAQTPANMILLCCINKTIVQNEECLPKKYHQGSFSECQILKATSDLLKNNIDNEITSAGIAEATSMVTEEGAEFLGRTAERKLQKWLICHSVQGQILTRVDKKMKTSAPVGGIAMALENEETKLVPRPISDGKLFCFLPLPQNSKLPVHVNGCFAVSSDRRHIVEPCTDDKYSPEGKWNEIILREVISKAYLEALGIATHLTLQTQDRLWPTFMQGVKNKQTVAKSVLEMVVNNKSVCLFANGSQRASLSEIVFLKPGDFAFKRKGKEMNYECYAKEVMTNVHGTWHFILVDMPVSIYENLHRAGFGQQVDERMFGKERFFRDIFFPNIKQLPSSRRDPLLLLALTSNNQVLENLVRGHPCIPAGPAGLTLKRPHELIHPEGQAAGLFTEEDGRFPYADKGTTNRGFSFRTPGVLRALERVGMARDNLGWDDICDRASSVTCVVIELGLARCKTIIKLVSAMLRSQNKEALVKLKKIPFLPVMSKPENYHKPWFKAPQAFCSPEEAFLSGRFKEIGSVAPVIDEDLFAMHHNVKEAFSLASKEPSCNLLGKQLDYILSSKDFEDEQQKRDFQHCICSLFKTFEQKFLRGDEELKTFMKERMEEQPCILIDDKFVLPSTCAFECSASCEPRLNQIPQDLKLFCRNMLKAIGVRERFLKEDFILLLKGMHDTYQESPLDPSDLEVSFHAIDQLVQYLQNESGTLSGTVFIPDTEGILRPCSELCFDFKDWFEPEKDTRFAHDRLSMQVGNALRKCGLNSPRQQTIDKRCFPFGQSEKLTNRIKRILHGYPFDSTILKEMLQNADDAGATELHFILDPRTHSKEKIFDEKWAPLQGPSLCVYNNKPFTQADLKGIQNLGEGSKSKDPTKTGQYGVGFNCIYHITDTPTFLTHVEEEGDVLVVFDPTRQYVSGTSARAAGRKYNDLDYMRQQFPDVFQCYLTDQFPVNHATMFRLPLRCVNPFYEEGLQKHLDNKNVTVGDIENLLQSFEEEAANCVLFLRNVREVRVSHIDMVSGNLKPDYKVSTSMSTTDLLAKQSFMSQIKEESKNLRETKFTTEMTNHQVMYSAYLEDSHGLKEHWKIVQTFGFENLADIPGDVINAAKTGDLGLLPIGGIAALVSGEYDSAQNIQSLKKGKRKKVTGTQQIKTDKGKIDKRSERHIYCFLPLPVKTEQSVHMNGHFALDYENRKSLWAETSGGYRTSWNKLIMEKLLAPAHLSLMKELQKSLFDTQSISSPLAIPDIHNKDIKQKLNVYNSLFPKAVRASPYVQHFMDEVYRVISGTNAPMLPVFWKSYPDGGFVLSWFGPKGDEKGHGVFKSLPVSLLGDKPSSSREKRDELISVLLDCGIKFYQTPIFVYENFLKLAVPVKSSSPEYVFKFLVACDDPGNGCLLENLPLDVAQSPIGSITRVVTLLSYISNVPDFYGKLQGLPLLVTTDGILRKFDENRPVYCTIYNDLFPTLCHEFIHTTLLVTLFSSSVASGVPQFRLFDIQALESLLPQVIDAGIYKSADTYIHWDPDERDQPIQREMLGKIWQFVISCFDDEKHELMKNIRSVAIPTQRQSFSNLVKLIEDWHLIPASTASGQQYLLPLKWPHAAVSFDMHNQLNHKCIEAFKTFDLPTLSRESFLEEHQRCFRFLVQLSADLREPDCIIFALQKWLQERQEPVKLGKEYAVQILTFFSVNVDKVKETMSGIETIRKLPIFLSCTGEIITLQDLHCFLVPNELPDFDVAILSKQNTVFLYQNDIFDNLMTMLRCQKLDTVDVYCQFILPHFHAFSDESKFQHLLHLANTLKDLDWKISMTIFTPEDLPKLKRSRSILVTHLESLPILPGVDGRLQLVSSFYDPEEPVFHAMLSRYDFPPYAYWEKNRSPQMNQRFLNFFRQIGLISKVKPEKLLQFARELESMSLKPNQDKEDLVKKSKLLLKNLFQEQGRNSSLYHEIRQIRFVPLGDSISRKANENLHLQCCRAESHGGLVSFENGLFLNEKKWFDLSWAAVKLLPTNIRPEEYYLPTDVRETKKERMQWILESLAVTERLSLEIVVSNIEKVCTSFKNNIATQKAISVETCDTLNKILKASYTFLNEHRGDTRAQFLKNIPCVAVDGGKDVVCPNRIIIDIRKPDEIPPYLYKIPDQFGPFKDLLLSLGATEKPAIQQYQQILADIFSGSCEQGKLLPNELNCSYKAYLWFLFLLVTGDSLETMHDPLYLPNQNKEIALSSDLLFIDDTSLRKRVKELQVVLVLHPTQLQADCEKEQKGILYRVLEAGSTVFANLPESHCPKNLSSVIEEKMVDVQHHLDLYDCPHIVPLQSHLRDPLFQQGLERLARAHVLEDGEDSTNELISMCNEIEIKLVDEVKTYLQYNGKRLSESETKVLCYLEFTDSPPKLYISQSENNENSQIYLDIATQIRAKFPNIKSTEHLSKILSCKSSDISKVLDRLRIAECAGFTGIERTLPKLGSRIPVEEHHLLAEGFEIFNEGDYIGYCEEDPDKEDAEPTIIHAKVVEAVNPDDKNRLGNKYWINLGERGIIEVSVLDLYKWYRPPPKSGPVALYTGNEGGTGDTRDREEEINGAQNTHQQQTQQTLDEVFQDITTTLEDAWKIEESDRRKVIKRLLLKWHPDKNLDNQDFCTKTTQHIQSEMSRLERGQHTGSKSSPTRSSFYDDLFDTFYRNMGARARQQQKHREEYEYDRYHRNRRSGGSSFFSGESSSYNTFYTKKPQPEIAKKWLEQAELDLKAALRDQANRIDAPVFPEWICFKSYQAVEKALKATQTVIDARLRRQGQSLFDAAQSVSSYFDDHSICEWTRELQSLLGSSEKMQYPDPCGGGIPHDIYDEDISIQAQELARKIVYKCKNVVLLKADN